MKRIKHLKGITMTTRVALAVMSYESGQKQLYKTFTAMTDGQLLAALEMGRIRDHSVKGVDLGQDEEDDEGTERDT
jgi:hypothetical protein